MFNSREYEEMFEEYDSTDEVEKVIDELEDEGYHFQDGIGLREPDLSEEPGIHVPGFGEVKKPVRLADGFGKIIETVFPNTYLSPYIEGIVKSGDDRLYATTDQDYRNLSEISEEVLEE